MARIKRYDQPYFDNWYRRRRIASPAELGRMVACAVAITEQVIARPLRSVLDVGAGEGRWQPALARLRPRARYAGVDSSEWAVAHWGRRRNLRLGDITALDQAGLDGPFDLVVVADVLHYLPDAVLRAGIDQVASFVGGVAFMPTFTRDDDIEGDRAAFQPRSARDYRRVFHRAGLVALGPYAWTTRAQLATLSALERLDAGDR